MGCIAELRKKVEDASARRHPPLAPCGFGTKCIRTTTAKSLVAPLSVAKLAKTLSDDAKDDLAPRVSALAQLMRSTRFAEREDVFDNRFDHAGIDQLGDSP